MNFYKLFNKLQGKPYSDSDSTPPTESELLNYTDTISNNSSFSGTEDGGYELRPLTDDDMKRYATDDVVDAYYKLHKGKNPTKLGDPMSDDEFKKYHGMKS